MGVLGKDIFDFHRPQTNTKVEFGASAYWVEDRPEPQPYGAVLTEILNLDVAPFQELLDQLNTAVQEKSGDVLRAYMNMKKGLASLPLYRLYLEDFRVFGDMPVEAFVVGEAQDAFAEFVMQEDHDLPTFMQQQINDIRLIQERYAWFLDGVFSDAIFEKKKGQRKIPLAPMVYSRGYEVFISGICLKKLRSEQHETNLPFLKICASCEAGAGLSSQSLHFWGLILMRLGLAGGFDLFCTLESSAAQSSFGICQPSMSVCSR